MKPMVSKIPAFTSNDKPSAIAHRRASLRDAVEAADFMGDAATLVGKRGGRNPRNSHLRRGISIRGGAFSKRGIGFFIVSSQIDHFRGMFACGLGELVGIPAIFG
jgi:hypothetical protein